jgi:hypothetical protein
VSAAYAVLMPPFQAQPAAAFLELVVGLERRLEELLASPVYGRGPGRRPPPRTHGVYLFSRTADGGLEHLYVGRVGVTERARAAGGGHSNFRTRLAGHTRPSSGHNQATFAFRLAVEHLGKSIADLPATRAERAVHPEFEAVFRMKKELVTSLQLRVAQIEDDFESYLFEPYAAFRLGTPYNSWATS